ncbi:hypothetical protein QZH41_010271, partial [Actinostola sp. cb2023]
MDYDDPDDIETTKLLSGLTDSSTSSSKDNVSFTSRLFCCRNVLVCLQFCGFVAVYGMRVNLSVALVAMVNQTYAERASGNTIIEPECRRYRGNSTDVNEGVTYPAATIMWSRWAPPLERSTYIVLCFTGGDFGAISALPLSGWLSSLTFIDDGWPLAFYVFGALGVFWFIAWMALIHESPALHPRISQWEKQHIISGIGNSQDKTAKKLPTPWKSILTSVPVWSMFITSFSYGWGWYVFLTCLPSFFKEVLDFDIKENGALTALPFIASLIAKNISANFSDWLQRRFGWSTTCVRKMFAST